MKKYRKAVSILALKDKSPEILLVHKPRLADAWQLPQGGIEAGESDREAAKRELREETGLKISGIDFMSRITYSYDFPPEYIERFKAANSGQTLSFVVVKIDVEPVIKVDNSEINDYRWVTREGLKEFIKRKEYLDVIYSVLDEFGKKSKNEEM
ncbi:hypothetical protein A3C52_05065 [Candidatus Peribacteria bacterium RIFCSPHIGHO2_02_FULL_51_15]|nr:MAG: hypothetical protein A3C52_05065 [Candidatus Peribacteria bacterium RIFCSPHIGHO2_02_FULL_51_15]